MIDRLREARYGASSLISFLVEYEALRSGLQVRRLSRLLVTVSDGKKSVCFHRGSGGGKVDYGAFALGMNKAATKMLWEGSEIGVTPYVRVTAKDLSIALSFAQNYNFEVVLKPIGSAAGNDVFIDFSGEKHFRETWNRFFGRKKDRTALVEKTFRSRDFRAWVVNGELVAVFERKRPKVVGDGKHSIRELITHEAIRRDQNPYLATKRIKLDSEVLRVLKSHNLSMDSTLEANREVEYRNNANTSSGGTIHNVTPEVSEPVKRLIERAIEVIPGLHTTALDIFSDRLDWPTTPSTEQMIFNEVEPNAGFGAHFPDTGDPVNIAGAILESVFGPLGLPDPYRHDFDEEVELTARVMDSMARHSPSRVPDINSTIKEISTFRGEPFHRKVRQTVAEWMRK